MGAGRPALYDKALALARAGRRRRARRVLEQFMKEHPRSPAAWLLMAQLVENDAAALVCLREYLRLAPEDEQAWAALRALQEHAEGGRPRLQRLQVPRIPGPGSSDPRLERSPLGRFFMLSGMGTIVLVSCLALSAAGLILLPFALGAHVAPAADSSATTTAYHAAASGALGTISGAAGALIQRVDVAISYPALMADSAWRSDLLAVARSIDEAYSDLQRLEVPERYRQAHAAVLDAAYGCQRSAASLTEAVNSRSTAGLRAAAGDLAGCATQVSAAQQNIDSVQPRQ